MNSVGLTVGPITHLDHLGVLCDLLDIPLYVAEDELLQAAKTYYPNLRAELKSYAEITSCDLMHSFDALLFTSKVWACETCVLAKDLFKSPLRVIYCPHGNSDKGHSLQDELSYPANDIELYYGDHMLDLLKKIGVEKNARATIRIGNFRYYYYKKYQSFYDALIQKMIFSHLQHQRQTVLYAPTWNTEESPTSFFSACGKLIDQLPDCYNLIVKLHPFLEKDYPAQTYQLLGNYEGREGVMFLEDFPPIFPLLAHCDLYLGDFSSIGYDFLTFDRPLFFFDPFEQKGIKTQSHFLHQCGLTIPSDVPVFEFIAGNLEKNQKELSAARKKIYDYTFGEERSIEAIKQDLLFSIEKGMSKNIP
jgi:hypothetical protein